MQALRTKTLVLAVLAGLSAAGGVIAQSASPTPAQQRELEAARAQLDRAAQRYSELARKYRDIDESRVERALQRRPVLGVLLAPDDRAGVRIAGVTPESAAADAGLKSGDRLLGIDGKQILGSEAGLRLKNARKLLGGLDAGTPVAIAYERDGRKATMQVTPRLGSRAVLFSGDGLAAHDFDFDFDHHLDYDIDHDAIRKSVDEAMRVVSKDMPRIDQEILRLGDCGKRGKHGKDAPCRLPMLAEAFRWSGLNLAAIDPQLGRYFGTDRGVLVLSTGDELAGLQPGDVVQKIDGRSVDTPREAMAALRAKPADSSVRVDYLRDRKSSAAQVKVPAAMPFRILTPPAPPAPPAPPTPPASAAPSAPPAPPAPPNAAVVPPAPPAAPAFFWSADDAQRRFVFIDDDGRTIVLEGDDAPLPPAPPAPPPLPGRHGSARGAAP